MFESLHSVLIKSDLSNDIVCWIPYNPTHNIVCHFTTEQWHMIVEAANDEKAFRQLLMDLKYVSSCWLLKDVKSNIFIGFCFMNITDWHRKIVLFHGGGWSTDLLASRKYLQGANLMLNTLRANGMKIRTECKKENVRAERFIKVIGFRCFRRDNERSYFYLPDNFSSIIKRTAT